MENSKILKSAFGENLFREWEQDGYSEDVWDALDCIKDDEKEGCEKLLAAAQSGSKLAMLYLGTFYLFDAAASNGNQISGEHWLKMSSDMGSIEAKFCLGAHYMQTDRVVEGHDLLNSLSKLNYSPAQFRMGLHYATGQNLDKNTNSAVYFFRLASKNGHLVAKQWLAHISMTENLSIGNFFPLLLMRICNAAAIRYVSFKYPNSDRLRR